MGKGPFASQRFKQLKAMFTSSGSTSAAVKQANNTGSDDTLDRTKSSFGEKLARILHRRRDSGYGSSGHDGSGRRSRKTKTTTIPMPLDPKASEAAGRGFVRYQSTFYPPPVAVPNNENSQDLSADASETVSVASQSECVGSDASASSSEYTQIVVYPPRLVSEVISSADVGVANAESPSYAPESAIESRPASVVSSASSSEYTQTVLYHGPLSGSALEAAVMQYTADRAEGTQQGSQTTNDSVASERSSSCSQESSQSSPDTHSSADTIESKLVDSLAHNGLTQSPAVQAFDSHTPYGSTHSPWAVVSTPMKRNDRHAKQSRLSLYLEENTIRRRQHHFFKKQTIRAAEGGVSAMANALDLARYLENHPDPNSFIQLPLVEFYRHEMSKNDWLWLRRAQMINTIRGEVRRGRLAPECGEIIIIQLVPESADQIIAKQDFEVHLDYYVKEGRWCSKDLAQKLLLLQVRPEELRLGPCAVLPEPVKAVYPQFHKLPYRYQSTTTFALSRLTQLEHLCQAVAYERKEWRGLSYENGPAELQLYCAAFHATKCGQAPPAHLVSHYRKWTYLEQRLLRAGELVVRLLQDVNEGRLQLGFFQIIRGTLLNIAAQPYCDLEEFVKYLYSSGMDAGIEISRFPHIMILHPEYEFLSQIDEERVFSGLLANSWRFQEEEEARLQEFEAAKKAYAKAIGANSIPACLSRRVRKVLHLYKEPIPFHCTGCMQGHRCISAEFRGVE